MLEKPLNKSGFTRISRDEVVPVIHRLIGSKQIGHVTRAVLAAERIGLTQKTFLQAAERGEIDVPVMKIGRRFFVRKSELERWLNPPSPPADDCADLF